MPAPYRRRHFRVFPQLTCTGQPIQVGEPGLEYFTKNADKLAYCAGKETTFEFLENVLTEVANLFDRRTSTWVGMNGRKVRGNIVRIARRG